MNRLWPRTLFGRLFTVQLVSLVAVFVVFGGLVVRDQARAAARQVAPIWAAAVQSRLAAPATSNSNSISTEVIATEVLVTLGTPPANARYPNLLARYRALIQELGQAGLSVRQIAISRNGNTGMTWLEVADKPGSYRWVGITEDVEEPSLWGPTGLGLLLALGIVVASTWWMSRTLTRPLTQLKNAMHSYARTGTAPALRLDSGTSETRNMAAQFTDLVAQHEQNERTREIMLAGISHDLRSPLGRIRMGAELLADSPENQTWKQAIIDNVVMADRLLESFMDYARAQQQALDTTVDLRQLVLQQCAMHAIQPTLAADLPEQVVVEPANAVGLERALSNLLDNARHHGQAPITVTLAVQNGQATLTVSDQGPGMETAKIQDMLRPFHRGQASRNRPGTGLGLAIVNETVRRHGGQLNFRNTGPGLTVEMVLPTAGTTPASRTSR